MIGITAKVCAVSLSVPTLFRDVTSCFDTEALQAKIGTLSLDKQAKLDEDAAKKEKKAEAKAGAAEKKKKVRDEFVFCPMDVLTFCAHDLKESHVCPVSLPLGLLLKSHGHLVGDYQTH